MLDVGQPPGREVVEQHDLVTAVEQAVGEV